MAYGNIPIEQRIAGNYTGFAYEALTVTTAVKTPTAATIVSGDKKARVAYITVESNPINFTYDGTTPSATVGHNLTAGSTLILTGYANIAALKMYRSGGADATVKITYEA